LKPPPEDIPFAPYADANDDASRAPDHFFREDSTFAAAYPKPPPMPPGTRSFKAPPPPPRPSPEEAPGSSAPKEEDEAEAEDAGEEKEKEKEGDGQQEGEQEEEPAPDFGNDEKEDADQQGGTAPPEDGGPGDYGHTEEPKAEGVGLWGGHLGRRPTATTQWRGAAA